LHRATIAALNDPEVRRSLGALGVDIVGDTPDEFSAYIQAEIPKWAEVIKASGAKAQ
jgi:tripartite-type tricarboxylate transporter receptor subunit TctC